MASYFHTQSNETNYVPKYETKILSQGKVRCRLSTEGENINFDLANQDVALDFDNL